MPSQPDDLLDDPEDPKAPSTYGDHDRHDELDERIERDLFDSPNDAWRELEDLEAVVEIEDEPTGRYE